LNKKEKGQIPRLYLISPPHNGIAQMLSLNSGRAEFKRNKTALAFTATTVDAHFSTFPAEDELNDHHRH